MKELNYTPENITRLGKDDVFVFGSNLAGNHAGGAARIAREKFGAVMGQGVGLQGQSYAIPTMQGGVETIKPYVDEFIRFASTQYNKTFYVTRIGCGIAGFRDEEIAPLFEGAINSFNIRLPKSFVDAIYQERKIKVKQMLTPWPVTSYTLYNLLVDLMLSVEGSLQDCINNIREVYASEYRCRHLELYPSKGYAEDLESHKNEIVSCNQKKHFIEILSKMMGLEHLSVKEAPIGRYSVSKAYNLAYILLRVLDFDKPRSFGFGIATDFEYTFFSLLTGRWNCGDNSYMFDKADECVNFFINEMKEHENEITTNGKLDRNKFLAFVSQPYIWGFCQLNDNHKIQELEMISGVLYQAEHYGTYKLVDNYMIPTSDFSRPVFDMNKGRVKFPTYYLKEQFIKGLLAK